MQQYTIDSSVYDKKNVAYGNIKSLIIFIALMVLQLMVMIQTCIIYIYWINGDSYDFEDYCKLVHPWLTDEQYLILLLTYGSSA